MHRRSRKKATAVPRVALPLPSKPGRCYAMDFVHDRLANGRRFKCFTMTDLCSKEVPVIEVDVSIGGERVCRILDRLFVGRPWPETVILNNGQEFSGTALDTSAGLRPGGESTMRSKPQHDWGYDPEEFIQDRQDRSQAAQESTLLAPV